MAKWRGSTAESRQALRELRAELRDPAPVMDAAAVFLSVRPRSVTETRKRLHHLGYPDELVETVIDRLIEMEYLDDAAFARAWVESRDRARPRGETALRRELALKGVPRAIVDDVLTARAGSSTDGDPNRTAAVTLLARRGAALRREPDPARRRQKAYALLARNGFDPETCREAALSFVAEMSGAA
jgi:regulatory protein